MLLKACTYYVEILNSFNAKLLFKDTESAIRNEQNNLLIE